MAKVCLEEGCSNPRWGKGYCKYHQHRRTDKKTTSKPKKKIRHISKKREEEMKIYRPLRDKYMSEHQMCEVKGCSKPSNDLHHMNGRFGKRLYDTDYFMAVCRKHHNWIHEHPKESSCLGYLL